MDYQNRAGSKKGAGGVASDAQANLARRKQVEDLLKGGEEIPYTFQETNDQEEKLRKNPYIYKNHSGKLVCKLCNTMHVSWSSVERHLSGKKHGLNVLRRGNTTSKGNGEPEYSAKNDRDREFHKEVESRRSALQNNGLVPKCSVVSVRDESTNSEGVAIRVDYDEDGATTDESITPMIRIVSGLELQEAEKKDRKYLAIAYEPFEIVAIEIPSDRQIKMDKLETIRDSVDEVNSKFTFWDPVHGKFYVQVFFE